MLTFYNRVKGKRKIMKNKEINFTKENFGKFLINSKLYQYLYNNLTKAYVHVVNNTLSFYLKGNIGTFKQDFVVDYEGDPITFFVDFGKWFNAIQKFEYADSINITVTKSAIKISTPDSPDTINLGIISYTKDDADIVALMAKLPNEKKKILGQKLALTMNDEMISDFNLASSLFINQGRVNSIGLGRTGIIYADRSTILKTKFTFDVDDSLFKNLESGEDYIFIHAQLINLMNLIYKENPVINFSEDYEQIYWEYDGMELVYIYENRDLAIPTDEQLDAFSPQDPNSYFEVDLGTLKDALTFFNGFYEGSVWKPITFNCVANKEVTMRYKHPSADITKELPCSCNTDGVFVLESDAIKKVTSKVKDKRTEKSGSMKVKICYDDEAPGILCNIGDYCTVIFAKLEDDSDI